MADQFDQAQELDALSVVSALALQQKRAASEPKLFADGECWNEACAEPLAHPKLFCGPKCAQAYDRQQRK